MYGYNLDKTGFNPSETTITPATAPSLNVHWIYQSASRLIFDQPIAADGLVFWGSMNGYEYATDPSTGNVVWSTFVGQLTLPSRCTTQVPNPLGVTGTSEFVQMPIQGVSTPVLFVSGGNSSVYALNASTGAVIWQRALGGSQWDYMWDSPAVWNGSVYIGVASPANCPKTVRGQIFKLNASTGGLERAFSVVPNGCVGGGVWGSIAIDTTAKTLYVATGSPDVKNCPSTPKPLTPALLELKASDLSLVGFWQVPRADWIHDSDFGSTPVLFSTSGGTPMVAVANKNGLLYAFDRDNLTAGPVWQFRVDDGSEPQLAPSAYDGQYIYAAGGTNTIGGMSCKGGVYKVDPTTGAAVWAECTPGWAQGAVSMAPGLAVIGTGMSFEVYSADTGALLYTYTDTQTNSSFVGSASIANGQILYGNRDGNLIAVGT